MSQINIILIRHGEASASWGDDPDPGLSQLGENQAIELIDNNELLFLENYHFISSPKSRALMTAAPIAKKYYKDVEINAVFSEIPSNGIDPKDKKDWLTKIIKTDLINLPNEVNDWRSELTKQILSIKRDTIIFSHFMVINALIAELTNNKNLLCFYPDYTSVTKIIMNNNKVEEFYIGGERKTPINL